MNLELLAFHIGEAEEELRSLKAAIAEPDFDEESLFVGLEHAFHHLNSAWNTREIASHDEANRRFYELRRFASQFIRDLGAEGVEGTCAPTDD